MNSRSGRRLSCEFKQAVLHPAMQRSWGKRGQSVCYSAKTQMDERGIRTSQILLMQNGGLAQAIPPRVLRVRGLRAGSQSCPRTDGEASPGVSLDLKRTCSADTHSGCAHVVSVPVQTKRCSASGRVRCSAERLEYRNCKECQGRTMPVTGGLRGPCTTSFVQVYSLCAWHAQRGGCG